MLRRFVELADAGLILEKSDEVDLTDLVKTVSQSTIPEDITFEIDQLPVVRCDRLKAGQTFQNLFENALTHGKPRKIEVRMQTIEDSTRILIANDGAQIPHENRSKIFNRRFTTKKGGSGLGLAIVQKLVRGHGWKISLADTPETSFMIQIPEEP
ncbi:MAG: ATP-binding protein [Candidatus Heimdallarchaeota archaeon]